MTAKKKRASSNPSSNPRRKSPAKRPTASTTTPKSPPAAATPAAAPPKYSALDAAAQVLRETGQPMSCPELIVQMAARGYWRSPKGKTPASTLYAAMAREVKLKGNASRFTKTGPGRFAYRRGTES